MPIEPNSTAPRRDAVPDAPSGMTAGRLRNISKFIDFYRQPALAAELRAYADALEEREKAGVDVPIITGKTSDGYHTFDELYEHRITLWIALCKQVDRADEDADDRASNTSTSRCRHVPNRVWRSNLHSDGSSFDGWFVLGIGYKAGEQMTYHLPISKWRECDFANTLGRAPEFDGHSSIDVLERISRL